MALEFLASTILVIIKQNRYVLQINAILLKWKQATKRTKMSHKAIFTNSFDLCLIFGYQLEYIMVNRQDLYRQKLT